MDLSSIIAAIGRMPTEFRSRGDVSMVKLVWESGYVENQTLVTVDLLNEYFAEHPEEIDAWLRASWDNRGWPSWYLQDPSSANTQGKWVVGFHLGEHREFFESGADACGTFVKNWLIKVSERANASG